MADRETRTSRDLEAGCRICHGADVRWRGPQAQGTDARHHDITGHPTWCRIVLDVRYGSPASAPAQLELEAAIAEAAA